MSHVPPKKSVSISADLHDCNPFVFLDTSALREQVSFCPRKRIHVPLVAVSMNCRLIS